MSRFPLTYRMPNLCVSLGSQWTKIGDTHGLILSRVESGLLEVGSGSGRSCRFSNLYRISRSDGHIICPYIVSGDLLCPSSRPSYRYSSTCGRRTVRFKG
jgi:hypothetical protein